MKKFLVLVALLGLCVWSTPRAVVELGSTYTLATIDLADSVYSTGDSVGVINLYVPGEGLQADYVLLRITVTGASGGACSVSVEPMWSESDTSAIGSFAMFEAGTAVQALNAWTRTLGTEESIVWILPNKNGVTGTEDGFPFTPFLQVELSETDTVGTIQIDVKQYRR